MVTIRDICLGVMAGISDASGRTVGMFVKMPDPDKTGPDLLYVFAKDGRQATLLLSNDFRTIVTGAENAMQTALDDVCIRMRLLMNFADHDQQTALSTVLSNMPVYRDNADKPHNHFFRHPDFPTLVDGRLAEFEEVGSGEFIKGLEMWNKKQPKAQNINHLIEFMFLSEAERTQEMADYAAFINQKFNPPGPSPDF